MHAIASCIDYLTGYAAAFGAIVAMVRRQRDAIGADVRTSLARAACYVQLPFAVSAPGVKAPASPEGQESLGPSTGHRIFRTANGWLFVAPDPRSDLSVRWLCDAVGVQQAELLAAAIRKRSTKAWLKRLRAHEIAAHPVLSLAEIRKQYRVDLAADAPTDTNVGPYRVIRHVHPSGHRVSLMAPTWVRAAANPLRRLTPAVRYGSHSREIAAEIGYSCDEIDALVSAGVLSDHWGELSSYLPR